jgi:hypothetical protein
MTTPSIQYNTIGSQISFTTIASNTYVASNVKQVETGLIWKHYILLLRLPVIAFTCPLQPEASWFLDNGNWCDSIQVLKDSDELLCRYFHTHNTVDEPVCLHIPYCNHIMWYSTWSSLLMTLFHPLVAHIYHCHLEWADMSRMTNLLPKDQPVCRICTHSCWYCALPCQWCILALTSVFPLNLEALHWLSMA